MASKLSSMRDAFHDELDAITASLVEMGTLVSLAMREGTTALLTTDLKLAALLRMRLNTKEIAGLLNLSPRGVETQRYRLRKKINLNGEVDIIGFLEEQ